MIIQNLQTPTLLVDLDALEKNIITYQSLSDRNGKQLWPMVKTHKSLEIAKMQSNAGAAGFLCGTLDECEALCEEGYKNIMYAYPVASKESVDRVISLAKRCNFIIRLDDIDAAIALNNAAKGENVIISYTIIVDCGLHRFGVQPMETVKFADSLKDMRNIKLYGISSHCGAAYAAASPEELLQYAQEESKAIETAAQSMINAGYELKMISSGSTPTYAMTISDKNINIYHPGNYVFNDYIQISNHTAGEEDCALYILASIISHPSDELYICDAGAKCLGLDEGAHGNSSIVGHGYIKDHPEAILTGLSEEVGKIKLTGKTNLKVGDKIIIIPNHSCSSANLTSYYIGIRGSETERIIKVDVRGNSRLPKI